MLLMPNTSVDLPFSFVFLCLHLCLSSSVLLAWQLGHRALQVCFSIAASLREFSDVVNVISYWQRLAALSASPELLCSHPLSVCGSECPLFFFCQRSNIISPSVPAFLTTKEAVMLQRKSLSGGLHRRLMQVTAARTLHLYYAVAISLPGQPSLKNAVTRPVNISQEIIPPRFPHNDITPIFTGLMVTKICCSGLSPT